MGKDGGFMTAKAISKRIKAKGLGRLRWYCQMCEKQCRDENGFKCHTQSAGHQRQLALFSENPKEFITRFSTAFRREFLSILCQRYGTRMVNANTVYQEYIKDKDHIHMNATQWTTLSDFVKDLGKEGLCKVQDKEDGFWVSFVDRQVAERDRLARERDTRLLEEQHRSELILQRQIRTAARLTQQKNNDIDNDDDNDNNKNHTTGNKTTPLNFKISSGKGHTRPIKHNSQENALLALSVPVEQKAQQTNRRKSRWDVAPSTSSVPKTNASAPESDYVAEQLDNTEPEEPGGPWLIKNIAVKVKNSVVGDGAFVGKKGRVVEVIDDYGARVSMLDSNAMLELDQDDLETVIPKVGGIVLILTGKHKGQRAIIRTINVDDFNVNLTLQNSGEQLHAVDYECVSRLCTS